MTTNRLSSVLLVLAVSLAACSGPGSAAPRGINEGSRARDFALPGLAGGQVSLDGYRGKIVLVNFWATWCAPCRAEMPDFEAAYRAYKDKDFVVLGLNQEESPEQVTPFVEEFDITFPILLDEKGQVMKEYRVRGLPTSVLVDAEGIIRMRHTGYLSAEQLDEYLAGVLP